MKPMNTHKQSISKDSVVAGKQRSYNEVIEYLDAKWQVNNPDDDLAAIKQIDNALENVSQSVNTILVAGTNGKSLTAHFAVRLLKEEGLNVGVFYYPHMLAYNERIVLNNESISNKLFADIANEVLNTAETLGVYPSSYAILTEMALLYFARNGVDAAIMEVSKSGQKNIMSICSPKILAITRVADPDLVDINSNKAKAIIEDIIGLVKPKTFVVSADQSKVNLQTMNNLVTAKGGEWVMPIRKLATLAYPYEQLHGRCAALAERIAYIYINKFANKEAVLVGNSILTKQKGQRGRPTLEAKRQSELNPKKTLEQFWKETQNTLPGRFQLFDKEKPTILLDSASDVDALKNILLGIRLLHYQRPIKGLTMILGCNNPTIEVTELLRVLRYFFKKTSGQVIVCPIEPLPGHSGYAAWDVEKMTNDIKSMKIKARSANSFKEAFEAAQANVDERHGLVVITGSSSIVTEYWKYKGIKKV
jgi:folylpolyglutamate synthase/dihydrofolate synthase